MNITSKTTRKRNLKKNDGPLFYFQRGCCTPLTPVMIYLHGWLLQALRSIIDSPLNKYGLVGAIFVKIDGGALFEIKPHVRIPRTCKRFCGLISKFSTISLLLFLSMHCRTFFCFSVKNETYFWNIVVELLQKSCVRAKNTNEILLRVIEEPVTHHLPVQSHIVGWLYICSTLL